MVKVKICGIKSKETIIHINELKPDYIGFVFAPSKRQVSKLEAKKLKQLLINEIQAVGVFVNHNIQEIINLLNEGIIDIAQLHGSESEEDIIKIKEETNKPVIKAVSVNTIEDILIYNGSVVDYLLLDYGTGGTGKSFDWNILNELTNYPIPYFIAGGLNNNNVEQVLKYNPFGVDVSGGVEVDHQKDAYKIEQFIKTVRRQNND